MPINITAVGGSGTHTLQKVNVNLEEDYIYFARRDSITAFPSNITDDSAWVYRDGSADISGLTTNTVYYTNTDAYTIGFASTQGGSNIDLTEYTVGSVTLNYPNVFDNSFNISSVKYDNQQAVRYLTNSTPITGLTSGSVYYVKNQLTGLGGSALYEFTTFDFTSGGVTGRFGPTIEQLRTSYSSAAWRNTYLAQGSFQGYQDWIVPEDGVYEFNVKGAPGRQGRALGGGGSIIRGRVRLIKGETITIVVGQRGELPASGNTWPGSSGASWVVRKSGNIPLFVAGGGSSSGNTTSGRDAVTTSNGGTSSTGQLGGTNGGGSPSYPIGGGGGGFLSNGGNGTQVTGPHAGGGGIGFPSGLAGGLRSQDNTASGNGGFGGGGAGNNSTGSSGGAGGYSGGAGNSNSANTVGGGGGSFIFATATNIGTSNGLYNGSATILGQSISNLAQFNTGDVEGSVSVTLVERSVFGFKIYETPSDAESDTDPIEIAPAGSQYHALVPLRVDFELNKVNTLTPHGLLEGEAVQYFFTGTALGGLNNTDVYYVDRIDDYSYKLSLTPDPNFTEINLTTEANATNQGLSRVIVNTATNVITINNHGFLVDQPVRYSSGSGNTITPLQNNSTYYIKEVLDANRFTLSQSLQGPVIDFTSVGTGTNHSFILTVVNDLEDSLYIPTHGYVSGQTVRYQKSRDFVITTISSSTTTRIINTSEPHGIQVGSRVTLDGFARPNATATTPIAITRTASSGQTRSLTLASNHSYSAGMYVQISGFTGTNATRFNGIYILTVASGNTLSYTAEESVSITDGAVTGNFTIVRRPDLEMLENTRVLNVRSIASSGTTRTIVTNVPHYYSTGQFVWIQGISGNVSGIQDDIGEYFNGVFAISATSGTNQFSYVASHEGTPSNLQPSITFTTIPVGTLGVNASGTVYREVTVTSVSSTQLQYSMPSSSLTFGPETVIGRVSKIGVRIANRNLGVSRFGETSNIASITTDVNHDLAVGDRFTVKTLVGGTNQDVFHGTYRALTGSSGTTLLYTPEIKTVNILNKRLTGSTNNIINLTTPHDFIAGNFVYLENNNSDSNGFNATYWDNKVNIISRESTSTTRTLNTDNPHFYSVGDRIKISNVTGANASDFIGEYTVASIPTATQFTYTAVNALNTALLTITGVSEKAFSIATVPAFSVSNRSRVGTVADITTSANHDLLVGETVRLDNVFTAGVIQPDFIGEFVITGVPAVNRFTFTTANSGTVTAAATTGNIVAVNQIRYTGPTYTRTLSARQLISNTVASFTTTFDHYLSPGTTVTISSISGNQQSVFNGTRVIASTPTARTFTVTRAQQAGVTTFSITTRQRTLNVARITTSASHTLKAGDVISINSITGADADQFNGTHTVSTIISATVFEFFTLASANITSASVTGNMLIEQLVSENVSGTVTLNTIPQVNATAGNLKLREVPASVLVGELVTDTKISGLENQRIYYIQRVDANTVRLFNDITLLSSTDISSVGIGTHALVTFSVNFDDDTITIPNNGFSLGELVEYDSVGQTVISGLTSGTPYYIIPVNGNTFKLATSSSNAENNVAINLVASPAPVGRQKLKSLIRTPDGTYVISDIVDANTFEVTAAGTVPEIVKIFNPRTSLDITQNIIKVVSHGFNTGTEVTYSNGGGTDIEGLVDDTHYYVIVVNKDWIRLAETQEDASSGVVLTLSSFGAGLAHTLTSVQINGQITGTGTVTTTSGSVLVNGSGTSFSKILKVGDRLRLFPTDTTTPAYFASTDINTSTENITVAAHPFVTGDAVSFNPGTGGPIRQIFRISKSGQTVTIVTREPHGYSISNTATISGLSNASAASEFNGTYTIATVPDTFTFTYTHPVSIASAIANEYQTSGTVQTTGAGGVAPNPLVSNYYYFVRSIPFTTTATVSNRRRFTLNGFTYLEFTTSANHNLRAGNTFTVSGIGGVNPEVFNGAWTVHQVTSATVVIVNVPVAADIALGTPVIGGTLTPTTSNSLTLHVLKSEAESGSNAVDLTTQGSGSAMVLTKTVPSTPIIRRITAIGSDTQITVDRPYSTTYAGVNFSYPTFVYVRPQGYSLHRPFDGGVEMSTGFGTWYGSIIRQTRKYFRYQSGKGIQTSAGINFKPSIDIENMARIGSSQVVSVRTRRPHGLISGLSARIDDAETSQGVLSTVYNGTFQVTVTDSFNFTFIATATIVENTAYGFPRLHVTGWVNGALRAGMFDDQNGMFFEFDGQKLYAVRRSSTQQIAGTCAALQGSEFLFGTNTSFSKQLTVGDSIVLRGQTYKVGSIDSDTRLTIKPEFKGNSGNEREFVPGDGSTGVVRIDNDSFVILSHGFSQNLPLQYNAIDGSPIGGLINGRTYYVNVVDNNTFRLKASPTATQNITISSAGTGTPHSFTPAKTGIIATLTVDTRTPQEEWSIDVCDGQGVTGYNLDLSKIQMIYMDYSWYGAGKIRYGFKTVDGQVRYVHEYVHNNQKYESYFRSGNLPARYEVATFAGPTYIPSLFHWGTSVMMDGKFDDDRAYLFSRSSPSLNIGGTTAKQFGSTAINITPFAATANSLNDIITIPSHGFATGDAVSFLGTGSTGRPQANDQNPVIQTVVGVNTNANLRNETVYFVRVFNANNIILFYTQAAAQATPLTIATRQKTNGTVTITTSASHGFSNNDSIFINLPSSDTAAAGYNGVHPITVTGATTFTYVNGNQGGIFTTGSQSAPAGSIATKNAVNFFTAGNSTATYSFSPAGSLNNTSGANYQPLISLRLSPSVSEGLTGALGDRDVINRMQLRLTEIGIQTNQLIDVKVLLNGRLNNLNFQAIDNPSLVQIITHTSNDTISGGVQVYAFRANGAAGAEQTTLVDVSELFELSNSILGGNSAFPDGPDILTVAVARLTGNETLASAKLSWAEAQA